MKKLIARILFLTFCINLITACDGDNKSITGNEWLVLQKDCIKDLEAYAKGMDDVYTLYITDAITAEDFAVEINLLKQQYDILVGFYEKMKLDNPIKPESHSYLSRRGTDAIVNLYKTFGDILAHSADGTGTPIPADQLSYTYLAYRQVIISDLVEYMTALSYYEASLNSDVSIDISADNGTDLSEEEKDEYTTVTFPDNTFEFTFKSNDIEVIKGTSSVVLLHHGYAVCITHRKNADYFDTITKTKSIISAQTPHDLSATEIVLSNTAALPGGGKIFTAVLAKDGDKWNQVYAYNIKVAGVICNIVGVSLERPLTIQSVMEMQANVDYIFSSISAL